MFVDLVGSTALAGRLDPEDMQALVREYQAAVGAEVSRFDGHISQFLGDGVLAYFGWPHAHEDDAERAVRAALAIVAAIPNMHGPEREPLRVRIGIATGSVVVGELTNEGAGPRQPAIGDTPNLAARLQGIAPPGTVVIAESTCRLLGRQFILRALPPQALKGITSPVVSFAVLKERTFETRFDARHAKEMPALVGRDQEFALLCDRWRLAKGGEGQLVLLSGEAGIGKSRIANALIESVRDEPHFLLKYQCSPYHTDSALHPAIQHIMHAAGLGDDDDRDRQLDKLEALLSMGTDDAGLSAALIATLLGIDCEDRHGVGTLTPPQRRSRTLAALLDQLTGLARRKPVLWVFEDVHWIDPTSLELIELALDRIQSIRVLALVTARPSFVPSFGGHPAATRLALSRLDRASTRRIITRISGGKRVPDDLACEIVDRTDGVPLFIEEITKAMLESGVLAEDEHAYHLDRPLSALAIPTTLHGSLMARLDRLQPAKEVAQVAAVIGRNFDYRAIAALSNLPPSQLDAALRQLFDAELIFRRGTPPDASYLFKHALVRDAAYESLLKSRRTVLHGRLLGLLETWGEGAPELLAQHAEAAGMFDKALVHWERAAMAALSRPAYKEGTSILEHAIGLCRATSDQSAARRREQSLQLRLGQAMIAHRGYTSAATQHAFERSMTLADEIGEPALALPAIYGLLAFTYVSGSNTMEPARRFSEVAERLRDRGAGQVAKRQMAMAHFHAGRPREAATMLSHVVAAYDAAEDRELMNLYGQDNRVAAAAYLALAQWASGHPEQADRIAEQALSWALETGHVHSMQYARSMGVCITQILLGHPEVVESVATAVLNIAEEHSVRNWTPWALINLGWATSQLDKSGGVEDMESGMRMKRQLGARRFDELYLALMADAYLGVGRPRDATACMDQAFDHLRAHGDTAFAAELHRRRAALCLLTGDGGCDRAEADLSRSLEIACGQRALSAQLRAARDLARLWGERGHRQRAIDLLAPVYAEFDEGFETRDLRAARQLLDELA